MVLIKENIEKGRKVYRKDDNTIRKIWFKKDLSWGIDHKAILDQINPGYIKEVGFEKGYLWIDYRFVEGTPANKYEHDSFFIKKITDFCLSSILDTAPYVHGDWVLSNMLIKDESITLIDWDNVGIYPKDEVMAKLKNDLQSAFGEKFDSSSI